MNAESDVAGRHAARSVKYCWLLVFLLVPFLPGGVVVGDEAQLLKLAQQAYHSPLSFHAFAQSPDNWYVPHHLLWFLLIYATQAAMSLLHLKGLILELVVSCESVLAALCGMALCYTFLIRVLRMPVALSVWVVLGLFAGGYGVYSFCMGGTAESYMVLVMSARLFFAEQKLDERGACKLALLDILLIALKPYSLVFLAVSMLALRFSGRARLVYFLTGAILLTIFAAVRFWIGNPPATYTAAFASLSAGMYLGRWFQQFGSFSTGLLFCLPILWVLCWHAPQSRKALLFKLSGLVGCTAVFALYDFFDGDVAGGRYVFPFCIALLPELAIATRRLLARVATVSFLLPVAIIAFCPVALFSLPFFQNGVFVSSGTCTPPNPVVASWTVTLAKITSQAQVEVCYHNQRYDMPPRDAASPRLGLWRLAYLQQGGHSPHYRRVAQDEIQEQHNIWATRLVVELYHAGLGNPLIWQFLGLVPALVALLLALWSAMRISRYSTSTEAAHDNPA